MSIRVVSQVWDQYQGGGSPLLVLLALADWADDSGCCFPGVLAIAKKSRLSRSQSQRVLHKLINEGVVSVTANLNGGSPGATRHYRINVSSLTGRPQATRSGLAQNGSHLERKTDGTDATQTVNESSLNVKGKTASPDHHRLVAPWSKARPAREITFNVWREQIKAAGEKAITDYEPVWTYAEKIRIPSEWISLAWFVFKERYSNNAAYQNKKYTDWRQIFLTAVKANWFKLWFAKDRQFYLTTQGHQAELENGGVA